MTTVWIVMNSIRDTEEHQAGIIVFKYNTY